MTLTLVVLGRSREDVAQVGVTAMMADELVLVANPGARWGGLGAIGNHYLGSALGDVLGLVHADVVLSEEVCMALVQAASSGTVAGIVGRDTAGSVWSRNVSASTPVSTLDSCSVFVSRKVAHDVGLRFDVETFDSFHCCVEDFCLQSAQAGLPVVVVPGWAEHPSPAALRHGSAWQVGEHKAYKDKLERKWAGVHFVTT